MITLVNASTPGDPAWTVEPSATHGFTLRAQLPLALESPGMDLVNLAQLSKASVEALRDACNAALQDAATVAEERLARYAGAVAPSCDHHWVTEPHPGVLPQCSLCGEVAPF